MLLKCFFKKIKRIFPAPCRCCVPEVCLGTGLQIVSFVNGTLGKRSCFETSTWTCCSHHLCLRTAVQGRELVPSPKSKVSISSGGFCSLLYTLTSRAIALSDFPPGLVDGGPWRVPSESQGRPEFFNTSLFRVSPYLYSKEIEGTVLTWS